MSEEPCWRHVSPIELTGRKYRAVTGKGAQQEGVPVEMKNRKTEEVDAIIAWLDERIDRKEKDMSAGEDDSSWLADREYLQAYRTAVKKKARDAMAMAYGIPTSREYRRKRVIQEANPHFLPMPDARKYRHSQLPN